MSIRRCILALIAVLAISACGSSAASTTSSAPSAQASSAADAGGSPSSGIPSAGIPSANVGAIPAPSYVDSITAGMVCADLSAMVITGNSADPISDVASATRITVGQVIYAINSRCPKLQTLEAKIGD